MRRAYADVQEVSKRLGVWRASTGRSAARRAVGGEGVSRRVPCEGKQQRLDRQLMLSKTISFELLRALKSAHQHDQLKHATERHVEELPDHARPPELGRAKVSSHQPSPPIKPRTEFLNPTAPERDSNPCSSAHQWRQPVTSGARFMGP